MSKLFKLLFNRLTIVLLLLALQICFIVLVLQEVSSYFVYLDILFKCISFIYAFKLLGKNVSATIKLPLIISLILFPFLGIFLYYFSFENNMRKKFIKNSQNQTFTLESLYFENSNVRDDLLAIDKTVYSQSQYISMNTFLPAYSNVKNSFFESGELFFDSLIEDLKSAKHFIFLEFFIIGKGSLWNSILEILKQKVKEGVEVRVIYDDVGSFKVLPYKYNKILESYGIKCVVFNPITPVLSLMHNNRDHKKIAIIDGKIAYTGGVNISDEYINKKQKFGHWKDNGIKLLRRYY